MPRPLLAAGPGPAPRTCSMGTSASLRFRSANCSWILGFSARNFSSSSAILASRRSCSHKGVARHVAAASTARLRWLAGLAAAHGAGRQAEAQLGQGAAACCRLPARSGQGQLLRQGITAPQSLSRPLRDLRPNALTPMRSPASLPPTPTSNPLAHLAPLIHAVLHVVPHVVGLAVLLVVHPRRAQHARIVAQEGVELGVVGARVLVPALSTSEWQGLAGSWGPGGTARATAAVGRPRSPAGFLRKRLLSSCRQQRGVPPAACLVLHVWRGHRRADIRAGGKARRAAAQAGHIARGSAQRIEVNLDSCTQTCFSEAQKAAEEPVSAAPSDHFSGRARTHGDRLILCILQKSLFTWRQRLGPQTLPRHSDTFSEAGRLA